MSVVCIYVCVFGCVIYEWRLYVFDGVCVCVYSPVCEAVYVHYLLAAEASVSFLATETLVVSLCVLRPPEPPLGMQDME